MLGDLFPAQRTKHVKWGLFNAAHLKQALGPIIRQHRGGNSKAGNHQICQHCFDEIWIEIYRDVSRCLNPNSLSETRLGLAWIGFLGGGKATKSTNKPKPNNFGGYRLPRSYKLFLVKSGDGLDFSFTTLAALDSRQFHQRYPRHDFMASLKPQDWPRCGQSRVWWLDMMGIWWGYPMPHVQVQSPKPSFPRNDDETHWCGFSILGYTKNPIRIP